MSRRVDRLAWAWISPSIPPTIADGVGLHQPSAFLRIQEAGVRRQLSQICDRLRRSLHDKPPMIEQYGAQPGEFLAPACPSWTAVQAAGHYVPVAGVLSADRRIHNQDSSVQIADSK